MPIIDWSILQGREKKKRRKGTGRLEEGKQSQAL